MIVHIYQLLPNLLNGTLDDLNWPVFRVIFTSLMASTLSLLLTIISYIGNDRLHSEKRRIVCPGHMTALIWHLCMIAGRISALSLFAIAFGPYISVVIGIHWIACIIWTLFERTNFCGDVTTTPPKKRLYFELPFVLVISFVFHISLLQCQRRLYHEQDRGLPHPYLYRDLSTLCSILCPSSHPTLFSMAVLP